MVNHPRRNKNPKAKASTKIAAIHNHDHDYSALLIGVRASFDAIAADCGPLFSTDAVGLNDLYLNSLPAERQVHDCHCCARFIGTFGNLVAVNDDGDTTPVMWNPDGVPEFYHAAFAAMYARVKKARVASVFLNKQDIWGMPSTGEWSHIAVTPPSRLVYRERALTAGQAMAAAKENFRTVATALTDFTIPMLNEGLRLFQANALARSDKFIGPMKWLRDLQDRPKGRKGENILWRAIAMAPEGYCHPRASVIGPLLDDIAAGLPFGEIKAKFDAKLGSLFYQRPQVAPTAGNIKAAEEMVAKLGLAPSLERRFARLDELQAVWTPAQPSATTPFGGVFGHIKSKDSMAIDPVDMPAITMTWDKFNRTVLGGAKKLQLYVPSHGRFIGLTTAVNADAPPILKWDRDDERNPVAWYCYHRGSPASQWGLSQGWRDIDIITPLPTLWGSKPSPYLGEGVVLVISGAADTKTDSGNALFPECLRDDLHGIRSVVEAYSKTAMLGGRDTAAAGYDLRKDGCDCALRTFSNGAWTSYKIDRWD